MSDTIECTFTISDAETLLRILDHAVNQARNLGSSNYAIDSLCRKDCAARWREIRDYIASKLPENEEPSQ